MKILGLLTILFFVILLFMVNCIYIMAIIFEIPLTPEMYFNWSICFLGLCGAIIAFIKLQNK